MCIFIFSLYSGVNMIKLVVSDLDNTLLDKNNKINDQTLILLKECLSKGIFIVLGTGRLYQSAKIYKDMIGEDTYIICYNGSLIVDNKDKIVFSKNLDVGLMKKIVDFCKLKNLYCQFYEDGKILVEQVTDETRIDPDLKNVNAIEAIDFDLYDFKPSPKAMIVVDPNLLGVYQEELRDFLDDEVYIAQSQNYLIEIMPKDVDKGKSLEYLCDKLNIKPSEVMAIGDNTNDREMLNFSSYSIAVANAVDDLKDAAFYVCENERSLGVAEALNKFVL